MIQELVIKEISTHMIVIWLPNDTSTPSIDISSHNDVDSQSNGMTEDNVVNPTLDVEVIPVRRSARERKQTQFFGNPWLYRITYNLTLGYCQTYFSMCLILKIH